jgi:uncharacterized protein (TIGR00297 family)
MNPWLAGLGIGCVLALPLWWIGSVSISGACAGALLTSAFYGLAGSEALLGFGAFVILGSLLSRMPRVGKKRHEARGALQAIANTGVAAIMLVPGLSEFGLFLAYCAFSTALSDTASSELGLRFGKKPRRHFFGKILNSGDNGGMTSLGTIAGATFASVMGAIFVALGNHLVLGFIVAAAGLLGNLSDSLMGATVESWLQRKLGEARGNDLVNFVSTLIGSCLGWVYLSAL